MRLDHLLSKEKSRETRCVLLFSYQAKIFLVPMRLGDTPVPIPNTTVKTQSADGTALETGGRAGGRQIKKRKAGEILMRIDAGFTGDLRRKDIFFLNG